MKGPDRRAIRPFTPRKVSSKRSQAASGVAPSIWIEHLLPGLGGHGHLRERPDLAERLRDVRRPDVGRVAAGDVRDAERLDAVHRLLELGVVDAARTTG